jgi:hypothetical protein
LYLHWFWNNVRNEISNLLNSQTYIWTQKCAYILYVRLNWLKLTCILCVSRMTSSNGIWWSVEENCGGTSTETSFPGEIKTLYLFTVHLECLISIIAYICFVVI